MESGSSTGISINSQFLSDHFDPALIQVKAAGEKMESDLHEMSKPLTRGVDDEDRENHLKDVEYADDPMLQYMRKKRAKAEGWFGSKL